MSLMRAIFFYFFFLACVCTTTSAQDYQINSATSYDQTDPAAAIDSQNNLIVVWDSYRHDGNSGGIFAQRFDADYTPLGDEFQINSATIGNQTQPAVAMDPAGNFIVAWHGPSNGNEDIFARRFNANGQPLGSQFRVNSDATGRQLFPKVAAGENGNFVIVWESAVYTTPSEQWNVCFQLYDANGNTIGPEQQANTLLQSYYPDVAMDDYGRFTIAWMQDDSQHSYNQVMFRLYDKNGSPKADPNFANTTHFNMVTHPSISCAASGHFVVAWEAHPTSATSNDIYARWYKDDGSPRLTGEFVVNTYTPGAQEYPKVAMNNQRDFIVVWNSETTPGSNERDIHARRFKTSDGYVAPISDEFIVNTYTFNDQKYPAVVIRENGEFAVAWQSDGQDGSEYGIFGAKGPQISCADFNADLFVNFRDYCFLAREWLNQGDPLTSDLVEDNKIDYLDLAAFSGQWLTPCYDCTYADLNFDGAIDLKDYALLANNWLKQGPNLFGDIDGNGSVDARDLKILVFYWADSCHDICSSVDIHKDGFIDFADYALLAADWLKQGSNLAGDIDSNGYVDHTDLQILFSHWLESCE